MRRTLLTGLLAAFLLPLLPINAAADWQASGRFFYRDREQDLSGFTGTTLDLPARRVDVQVIDANTMVILATASTDTLGAYDIAVTDASTRDVQVRFLTSTDYTVGLFYEVLNNTSNRQVYSVSSPTEVAHNSAADVDFGDLTALPGAGGEAFNIFDVVLNGHDYLKFHDGGWPLFGFVAYWQNPGNDGTFFSPSDNSIHLTADHGYDDTVIGHEHGHFISFRYSKDNNPGGAHFLGENDQDIRLSWSEGYATYFASAARLHFGVSSPNPTYYIDSSGGPGAGNLDFSYDIEGPSVGAVGAASEVTIQALLWDIIDKPATPDDSPGVDDDAIFDRDATNIWEVTKNYLPQGTVSNVSMEDFWDGWFRPGPGHGREAEMLATFDALTVEFFDDLREDDDSILQANEISPDGLPTPHTFFPAGDLDYSWFEGISGQTYIIETTDLFSDGNTNLQIVDSIGTIYAFNNDRGAGDPSSRVVFTPFFDARFFTRVDHAPDLGVYGSYNLRLFADPVSTVSLVNVGGTTANNGSSRGTAWADINNDGYLDLYVCNVSGANALYRNTGDGNFVEEASLRGVNMATSSEGACFGDFDNDGDKDLYVCTIGNDDALFRNELIETGSPNFTNITGAALITDTGGGRTVNWVDYNRDGYLDLFVANIEGTSKLWRNETDGTFLDMTVAANLNQADVITSVWGDIDYDGDDDVFLGINNFDSKLMRNDDGVFSDITGISGTVAGTNTFAADMGDYDGDLDLDLAVTDADGQNFLYKNMGGGVFQDVSLAANAASGYMSTGQIFFDHDLDSDLDLYLVNFNDRCQLLDNVTGEVFSATGAGAIVTQARSVSYADYDNDGDPDAYVASQAPNQLLRNGATGKSWIQVDLLGTSSNRDGIGSRLVAVAGGKRIFRHVYAGHGFGSQSSLRVGFGIPTGATMVDSLYVDWPSGQRSIVTNLDLNMVHLVDESGAIDVPAGTPGLSILRLAAPWPNPALQRLNFEINMPAGLSSENVTLDVYSVAGRRVSRILEGQFEAGPQRVEWDLTDQAGVRVAPGIYLANLRAGGESHIQKFVVLSP